MKKYERERVRIMFSGSKKEREAMGGRIDTVIGEQTVIKGNIETSDTTHINGTLLGDIHSDGMLVIGETGLVRGNITASNVLVAGSIEGNLNVNEKLTVTDTGKITGEINTRSLVIDEGAMFEGSCNMGAEIQTKPGGKPEFLSKEPEAAGQILEEDKTDGDDSINEETSAKAGKKDQRA